jgi:transposase
MNCTTLGIDVAKQVFQLHGVDEHGHVVVQKRVSRGKLRATVAQLPACVIGMEACGSAQYWARELQQLGHTVKLISPQFVKPYVKGTRTTVAMPKRSVKRCPVTVPPVYLAARSEAERYGWLGYTPTPHLRTLAALLLLG